MSLFEALDKPEPLLRGAMALFSLFDEAQQASICAFVKGFYDSKRIFAHPGLECTAELLALVAGHAALVGGAQSTACFASVRWIYFCGDDLDNDGDALGSGTVRLNAAICLAESRRIIPGQNLVIHEFAHILDHQLGISGSTPALRAAYGNYLADVDPSVVGAPSPEDWLSEQGFSGQFSGLPEQEFFAYLSESFFTEPHRLAVMDRALYRDLVAIYGLDMASLSIG